LLLVGPVKIANHFRDDGRGDIRGKRADRGDRFVLLMIRRHGGGWFGHFSSRADAFNVVGHEPMIVADTESDYQNDVVWGSN
jgi:hypothetical protein